MPKSFVIDQLPMGITTGHAFEGETVTVRMKEFLSSEDGNDFIDRLDGISECYSAVIGRGGVAPSQVDTFLAIVTRNREVTAYCNELSLVALVRKKSRKFSKGEAVFKDDIADVEQLELRDRGSRPVVIPPDCGFALVFSHGWRKGLYYDYSVFGEGAVDRTDHLPTLFGRFYARLLFQELYAMTEDQWRRLTTWGWFPFIGLTTPDRNALLGWARQDRVPTPVFDSICANVKKTLTARMEGWGANELLRPHMSFLESARDAYLAGNTIACIPVLFPRIEGVLRALHLLQNPSGKPNQVAMAAGLAGRRHEESVLLPERFRQYLIDFYFRAFDERAGDIPLSRHSVAHGTARAEDCDVIRATLGFLILDQIFYHLAA